MRRAFFSFIHSHAYAYNRYLNPRFVTHAGQCQSTPSWAPPLWPLLDHHYKSPTLLTCPCACGRGPWVSLSLPQVVYKVPHPSSSSRSTILVICPFHNPLLSLFLLPLHVFNAASNLECTLPLFSNTSSRACTAAVPSPPPAPKNHSLQRPQSAGLCSLC